MIEKLDMYDGCCISSFEHKFLELANTISKGKLELGYLYEEIKTFGTDYVTSHGNTANVCFLDVSKELADELHKKGMGLMAWMTSAIPKEEEWYKKVIDAGADILCVNYPNKLKEFVGKP